MPKYYTNTWHALHNCHVSLCIDVVVDNLSRSPRQHQCTADHPSSRHHCRNSSWRMQVIISEHTSSACHAKRKIAKQQKTEVKIAELSDVAQPGRAQVGDGDSGRHHGTVTVCGWTCVRPQLCSTSSACASSEQGLPFSWHHASSDTSMNTACSKRFS